MNSFNRCLSIYLYKRKIVHIGFNKNRGEMLGKNFIYKQVVFYQKLPPKYNVHSELDGYIKILRDFKLSRE